MPTSCALLTLSQAVRLLISPPTKGEITRWDVSLFSQTPTSRERCNGMQDLSARHPCIRRKSNRWNVKPSGQTSTKRENLGVEGICIMSMECKASQLGIHDGEVNSDEDGWAQFESHRSSLLRVCIFQSLIGLHGIVVRTVVPKIGAYRSRWTNRDSIVLLLEWIDCGRPH